MRTRCCESRFFLMALIRCPNCDTLHDLDDAFLATGRRKVRCASCRTVFEADEPESDSFVTVAMPLPEPKVPQPENAPVVQRQPTEPDSTGAPEADASADAEEIMAAPAPTSASAPADAAGEEISADDLEALFADSAPAAVEPELVAGDDDAKPGEPVEAGADDHPEFDPDSLKRAQDAAISAASRATEASEGDRRARRGAGTMRKVSPPPSRLARSGMVAAMVMAASVGTLSVLVMLREDAVRLFPATAKVFDIVGLSASTRGLDIVDVQSLMMMEDGQETLEVTGRVINNSKRPLKLPVLRLAIRGGAGAELYVWTANADVAELGPGESSRFSRRLASPPADAQSVMVRFVAKDDIVAAIR